MSPRNTQIGCGEVKCRTAISIAVVTVRKLPKETHFVLKLRAARHGRSTEAEIRCILERAVQPEGQQKVGSALAAFGAKYGGLELSTARDSNAPMFAVASNGKRWMKRWPPR